MQNLTKAVFDTIMNDPYFLSQSKDGKFEIKHNGGNITIERFSELAGEFLEEELDSYFSTNVVFKEEV